MARDPITGKKLPPKIHDPVGMPKLNTAEREAEVTRVGNEMAEIRKEYAGLESRSSGKAGALSVRYRRLSLMFWHLTETKAPPIYGDM